MGDKEWLELLRPGHTVAVKGFGSYQKPYLVKIDKVTPTQIVAGSSRYRRKDGNQIGAGTYDRKHLLKTTPEMLDEIERNTLAREVKTAAESGTIHLLPLDNLRKILELFRNEQL